jgi:putative salt-induced outer membrane protein YdiY
MACRYTLVARAAVTAMMVLAVATRVAAQVPVSPPFREGTIDFALLATTGNSSALTLGLGGDVTVRPAAWVVRNRAALLRSETDDTLTAQSFAYLFRAEKGISPRLSTYGQYDYLRDRFAGVEHKNTVTGGVFYQPVDHGFHYLKVFAGLGYTNERYVKLESVYDENLLSGVLHIGWEYKLKFSETAEFSDDLEYEQAFSSADERRLDHIAAITARLTTMLSLKVSHKVRYVNLPPRNVAPTDTVSAVALVAQF